MPPKHGLDQSAAFVDSTAVSTTPLLAQTTNADVVTPARKASSILDGRKNITPFRTPHGDNHDIWINPKDSQIMIQANDGGANVSTDGRPHLVVADESTTAEIYGIGPTNRFLQLYGRSRTHHPHYFQSGRAVSTTAWRTGPGCETGPIMPHPLNPEIVYGSCRASTAS